LKTRESFAEFATFGQDKIIGNKIRTKALKMLKKFRKNFQIESDAPPNDERPTPRA